MTGEITLSGNVLPVGGIKEKVLAAHREQVRIVILPRPNKKDLEEIPKELRRELKVILVDRMTRGAGACPGLAANAVPGTIGTRLGRSESGSQRKPSS